MQESKTSLERSVLIEELGVGLRAELLLLVPYDYVSRQLDLGCVLGPVLTHYIDGPAQLFVLQPSTQFFLFAGNFPLQAPILLAEQFVEETQIKLTFRRVTQPVADPQREEKKKRVNDKTIADTLKKVAQWRRIHEEEHITLQEAAKRVGVPKKTLDDYYSHIREANNLNFDFALHQQDKIGVLRKFVRDNTKKQEERHQWLDRYKSEDEE